MRRRVALGLPLAFFVGLPAPASAHGIGGRADLPVPVSYFVVGASVVLVVSFLALSALWRNPRLQDPGAMRTLRPPGIGVVGAALTALGLAALGLVVAGGIVRSAEPGNELSPILVWIVFWLVVPFASVVAGDHLWHRLDPWPRLIGALGLGTTERPEATIRIGVWPGALALLAFTWMELVYGDSANPSALAAAALIYTAYVAGSAVWLGRETGPASFHAFATYNRLFASISPLGKTPDGGWVWRGWLRGLATLPSAPGLAALVVVVIGTVSYDGISATEWWFDLVGSLRNRTWFGTLALIATVGIIGSLYWGASAAAARLGGSGRSANEVAASFAHTLVPIGIAYAFAHYFTLVIFEGQALFSAISDPFARGWDLFGTADRRIDFFLGAASVWYIQVAGIVTGHVAGVVLAHDRALAEFSSGDAVRSQYAMLGLMVALTTIGLLILAG